MQISCREIFLYVAKIFDTLSKPPFESCSVLAFGKVASSSPGFATSSYAFSANLYREILRYVDDNFVVNPFALEVILGLARCGAQEETAQEIKSGLSFPQNPKDIEAVIKSVYPSLKQARNFVYLCANRIYLDRNYAIRKDFKTIAEQVYDIELEHIDFVNSNQRCQTINEWVKNKTNNKMVNFMSSEDVDGSSKMILISATYFTMNWMKFFQKDMTAKGTFHVSSSRTVEVDYMEKTGIYNYYESSELKAKIIEMPLEAKVLDLVMVLPNEVNGLVFVENRLSSAFTTPKFTQERVNVIIPKVNLESKIDLRKVLQHLGIKKAFNNEADFNGIIAERGVLYMNHVIQKTVTVFQDFETSDPRALSSKMSLHSKRVSMACKKFPAQHPFLFYVKAKNVIILTGRITKP